MSDDLYYWNGFGNAPGEPERDPSELEEPTSVGIDFKSRLNPAQYEAVTTTEGPILVVAGAGSGKTRTLVHRVAWLVENHVFPEAILLLTFTRKAAGEMLTRAGELVGGACDRVSGGTFHSLANVILRRNAGLLGYPAGFGIMDRSDMEEVLGRLRKELRLGEKDKKFPKRGTLATIISKASNKCLPIDNLLVEEYTHFFQYAPDIKKLSEEYTAYKRQSALLDFDDLLTELARLLRENPEARQAIASDYQYIMVDEYQDTNPIQSEIVYALAKDHKNVMVVGDDAQSIYSFRGATFRNIMDFPKTFPGTRIIRLEENYRSTQPILDLTNNIISKAREKYEKKLFTNRQGGQKPEIKVFSTNKEQSLFICDKVRDLVGQGMDPGKIAVLFRASNHSYDLELELTRNDIDFIKVGGRRFLESAHIKDLLALLRVAANPGDGMSLTRALLLLEGIGPKTAGDIVAWVGGKRDRVLELDQYEARPKVKKSMAPMIELFRDIATKGVRLAERIERAWRYYEPVMEGKFDDYPTRLPDVKEFMRLSEGYTSLVKFLADMTLEPPNTSAPREMMGREDRPLVLSTVHSAKGLEWHTVFIISAVEGRFPMIRATASQEELDEERRLMYVAATRAEDELYFLCPLEINDYSYYTTQPRPSRFLSDIPSTMFSEGAPSGYRPPAPPPQKPVSYRKSAPRPKQKDGPSKPAPTLFSTPAAAKTGDGFSSGARVSHPVFGLGRVVEKLEDRKIKVDFDHFGVKTLHLDYAGLKSV